ncbi:purine-nucleoside phosphorylase [bacterium]|nr:MAG: purine-nucleoside phosphorylase [bacterium]
MSDEALAAAAQRLGAIDAAVILGSGLGAAVTRANVREKVPVDRIAGMPRPQVTGHPGFVALGEWSGKRVAVFVGRAHAYEGYTQREVTFPVRAAAAAGARTLVVTNAAGGLNEGFEPGDLMLIADQVNFTGSSPLLGPPAPGETRFPDMTGAYTPHLRDVAREAALRLGITLREGVYCGALGPAYETPAEVRFYRTAGGDAVGMSTVAEVIQARALGLHVAGVSVIANVWHDFAAISHAEVLASVAAAVDPLGLLLSAILAAA